MPTQPGGSGRPVTTVAPAAAATAAVASDDSSSTTSTSATPGAPTTRASNGPIRSSSSRAGTTTLIAADVGTSRRVSGGRRRAARASADERPPPWPATRTVVQPPRSGSSRPLEVRRDEIGDDAGARSSPAAGRRRDGSTRRPGTAPATTCGCGDAGRRPGGRSTTCRRWRRPAPGSARPGPSGVSVSDHDQARAQVDAARGQAVEHALAARPRRRARCPGGVLTSRNQFSSPAGAWLGSVVEDTQA